MTACKENEQYFDCDCEYTCDNYKTLICDGYECSSGCYCSGSTPIRLNNGHCGGVDDCTADESDKCPADHVYESCGCVKTCDTLGSECDPHSCSSGCFCPPDRPVYLEDHTCGTEYDCPVSEYKMDTPQSNVQYMYMTTCTLHDFAEDVCAPLGLVYKDCGCQLTCQHPYDDCHQCESGCFCPAETPVMLEDGSCGTEDHCPKSE